MKKLSAAAIAAIFFSISSMPGAAAGDNEAAPVAQEIAVTLVPAEHLLRGDSTLNYAGRPETLTLTLNPAARIDRVSSAGRTSGW